jgi:hypothetical protein
MLIKENNFLTKRFLSNILWILTFYLGSASLIFALGDRVEINEVAKNNKKELLAYYEHFAPAQIDKDSLTHNHVVEVAGFLRMVNSINGKMLVVTPLTNFDIHLKINKEAFKKYSGYQGQFIFIKGILSIKAMHAPDGRFLHNMYFITPNSMVINPII